MEKEQADKLIKALEKIATELQNIQHTLRTIASRIG